MSSYSFGIKEKPVRKNGGARYNKRAPNDFYIILHNMKYLFIVGAALLLLGGYVFFSLESSVPEQITEDTEVSDVAMPLTGTVTDVNLDGAALDGPALITIEAENGDAYEIAVPTMGIQLCAAYERIADPFTTTVGDRVTVSGELDEFGRIVPCEKEAHYLEVTTTAHDAVYGFSFEYRKGPDGYTTLEDTESANSDYVTGVTLFNTTEYEQFLESTDVREGPPALHVRVYENSESLNAAAWITRNPRESNIEMALGGPEEEFVGGVNAVQYVVDGLYPINTYVVAHGQYVYVLMGAYREPNDALFTDFEALVSSFTVTSTETQQKE